MEPADSALRPRGAPPPAPPRSFLAERGEFDRAPDGSNCVRRGPPPPGPLPSQTARGEGGNSIPLRQAVSCIPALPRAPDRPLASPLPHAVHGGEAGRGGQPADAS